MDLVRKLAAASGPHHLERCKTDSEAEAWYRKQHGESPNYSKLLEHLAPTQSERQSLIRGYFEPTSEEKTDGKKIPTKAHHAIADLVARGFVRLIITTNFDRLLEDALRDSHPHIISRPQGLLGAVPLVHSDRCTIVKLHGDYVDIRSMNTNAELATYDPGINKFLDQVFDEFGLLLCGWSGDWDDALRASLERCENHRYATYWTHRGPLTEVAARLADHRRAKTIQISSADDFFVDLAARVVAIDDRTQGDVISADVAVRMLRRYLEGDAATRIRLHNLVQNETERAFSAATSELFSTEMNLAEKTPPTRLDAYEAEMEILRSLISEGAAWGTSSQMYLWIRAIARISKCSFLEPMGDPSVLLPKLRRYPALWLVYSAGIAALAFRRFDFIAALFGMRNPHPDPKIHGASPLPKGLVLMLCQVRWNEQRDDEDRQVYVSLRLFDRLREKLRGLIPDDEDYRACFEGFEFLLALEAEEKDYFGAPAPYYLPLAERETRHKSMSEQVHPAGRLELEIESQGAEWVGFKQGMFGGEWKKVENSISALRRRFQRSHDHPR